MISTPKFWKLKFWEGYRKQSTLNILNNLETDSPSVNPNPDENTKPIVTPSFYKSLRPLLIFGRLLGPLPLQGLFHNAIDVKALKFNRRDWGVVYNILIAACMGFCVIVSIITLFDGSNKAVPQVVWSSNPVIFYFMGFYCYFHFLRNAPKFILLMHKWDDLKCSFQINDRMLRTHVNFIFGTIFLSAFCENILQQSIQLLPSSIYGNHSQDDGVEEAKKNENGGFKRNETDDDEGFINLRGYFERSTQPTWKQLFSYNPVFTVIIFFFNKFALYSWNFSDVLIMVMCRASYFQFKTLFKYTKTELANHSKGSSKSNGLYGRDHEMWHQLTEDFEKLYTQLTQLNKFLSPLVLVSYGVNLFFMTIHIHMGLTPVGFENFATDIYRTWSFIQISTRLCVISLLASKINHYAEEFAILLRKCPDEFYSGPVERTERFVKSSKIGISGLNCFVVTKPFMLSLISVVLTFEIVLFQASSYSFSYF